jgi:glycyl-tRNA synthetase beta chain
MSSTKNLLVELFVEELPPKALKKLGEAFGAALLAGLRTQGLAGEHSALNVFASPRRLAARISHVLAVAHDKAVSVKLMPVAVGLDAAGQPTPALLKKLAAVGADASAVAQLKRQPDGKAEALFLESTVAGATLAAGLQAALDEALAKLPIPKVMSYQLADGWSSVHFVRPAHGLVALHGAEVVPVQALGLQAGRQTRGHRFEAAVDPVVLQDADHYERQLAEQGAVIAGFAERRSEIVRQLTAAAAKQGLKPIDDDALLDEVTALVERPNVLTCRFEPEFLAVPPECLILTMKANQKYFPLLDAEGRLTNQFLVVSNIRPADASRVVEGNERVVRPRLADAKFFFDQDRKRSLESRVPGLAKVVYHGKLGTQGERVERLRTLARWAAERIGADPALADRAAWLAKADLLTDMVGEFPELQGVMGGYYARHDGEHASVAKAIAAQYAVRPEEPQDADDLVGAALLLADRAETLVGIWAAGQRPTGDKDPFALRRHALGIIRTVELCGAFAGERFTLTLPALLRAAADTMPPALKADTVLAEIEAFVYERCANQLAALFSPQQIDAVLAPRPPLQDVVRRLNAVKAFAVLPEAPALAAANKRVGNILKKADGEIPATVDAALLKEPAEQALAAALAQVRPLADAAFERHDHTASLQALAALKAPVDAFFDDVMVNAEDPALRRNRLALLGALHAAMNRVADLSRLAA